MLYLFSVDIQYIRLISYSTILKDRITPLPKPMQSTNLGILYVQADSVSWKKRLARGGVWADCVWNALNAVMSGKRTPQYPGELMTIAPLYVHLVLSRSFLQLFTGSRGVRVTSPVLEKQSEIATNFHVNTRNGASWATKPGNWQADSATLNPSESISGSLLMVNPKPGPLDAAFYFRPGPAW